MCDTRNQNVPFKIIIIIKKKTYSFSQLSEYFKVSESSR